MSAFCFHMNIMEHVVVVLFCQGSKLTRCLQKFMTALRTSAVNNLTNGFVAKVTLTVINKNLK